MLGAASALPIIAASCRLKRSISSVKNPPMAASVPEAVRKMRCTWAGRSSVSASEIIRESATGNPAVASVRKKL